MDILHTHIFRCYIGVIFDTSGTDDKEISSRVIQARKCIACLNGILWSKDIRKERKLNTYNALIKSSLLCGSETWRLTENNKRRVEATEMKMCAGLQSGTHLHTERKYAHQMLCCRITTLTFTFLKNFKISNLNKDHMSSLKMIWIRSKHVGAFLSVLMWTF